MTGEHDLEVYGQCTINFAIALLDRFSVSTCIKGKAQYLYEMNYSF